MTDAASNPLSKVRPLYWSVRRELWETRSVYIAPAVAAVVVWCGYLISAIGMPARRVETLKLDPVHQSMLMGQPFVAAHAAITLTVMIVAAFYCLGALFNERRDRSILFWKSLPVSDLKTVLSKAAIPMAVLPAVGVVVTVVAQAVIFLLSTLILVAAGVSAATPWTVGSVAGEGVVLLYTWITLTLWLAPVYGWLMLVSVWAKRAPFLWAVLPVLALALLEKVAFNSTHVLHLVINRITGSYDAAFVTTSPVELKARGGMPALGLDTLDPGKFVTSPGLWLGLIVFAACLAACVWLRRRREPI
jgi:ABC-2 type transport system permease protein